jgi:ABC-2 type transport system permease protein
MIISDIRKTERADSETAIETKDLTRTYGDLVALDHMNKDILHILWVFLAVILGSAIFSTFSLIIACWVKSQDRFMGIGQVLTMPLFFASNAIYPIEMMPGWLKIVARINPLTCLVDAMRALMIQGAQSMVGLGQDFGILLTILSSFR